MKEEAYTKHEQLAAEAFNKQSAVFDKIYAENPIVAYKRKRVREHVLKYLFPTSKILELNADLPPFWPPTWPDTAAPAASPVRS